MATQGVAPERSHAHHAPPARLVRLLGERSGVQLGRLERTSVDTSRPLWVTHYTLHVDHGGEVELTLPGGRDGELVQQVGHVPAPEDNAEIALAFDEKGRPVWAYHEDGQLSGGSLEFDSIDLR